MPTTVFSPTCWGGGGSRDLDPGRPGLVRAQIAPKRVCLERSPSTFNGTDTQTQARQHRNLRPLPTLTPHTHQSRGFSGALGRSSPRPFPTLHSVPRRGGVLLPTASASRSAWHPGKTSVAIFASFRANLQPKSSRGPSGTDPPAGSWSGHTKEPRPIPRPPLRRRR